MYICVAVPDTAIQTVFDANIGKFYQAAEVNNAADIVFFYLISPFTERLFPLGVNAFKLTDQLITGNIHSSIFLRCLAAEKKHPWDRL